MSGFFKKNNMVSHYVFIKGDKQKIMILKIFLTSLKFIWELMKQIRWSIAQKLTKLSIHPSWMVTRGQ